ncbi:MAG: hypothetical protein V4621_02435 [Pseudomonadota bacterium]
MSFQAIRQKLTPRRIILFLLCLGAFIVYGENFGYPFKVTDPADPRFRVEQFDFADYRMDRDALVHAFRVLFPVGTDKAFVDKVLVEYAGVESFEIESIPGLWRYHPRPDILDYVLMSPSGPAHAVYYDKNNKLLNAYVPVGAEIYPESPSHNDLYKEKK